MKTKNIKKLLFVFLVASFLILVIVPGTRAVFSEKETATINLNVEAPTFTVTFDGNGGTASFSSKDIALGHVYGELPTAEKCGNTFLGWYTGLDNGLKIESSDIFNVNNNQTLFARYENNKELYDVYKCEATRTDILEPNKVAKMYEGEHQDSMDPSKSTDKIYHLYSTSANGSYVINASNVVFANMCWQMIRTTDTGGVKLIYAGEPTITDVDGEIKYSCTGGRKFHFTSIKQSKDVSGTFLFASDYTVEGATFYLVDPVQLTIGTDNASEMIHNIITNYPYTCFSTSSSCYTASKFDSYDSGTNAFVYYSNYYSDSIGTSPFENISDSLGSVGYMHNSVIATTTNKIAGSYNFLERVVLDSNKLDRYKTYYFFDNYTMVNNTHKVIDPVKGDEIENFPSSLVNKYMCEFLSSDQTCSVIYYISEIEPSDSNSVLYRSLISYSLEIDDPSYIYLFSDSIADNGDGTFSMVGNVHEVNKKDWNTLYSSHLNKFVCMPSYYHFDSVNNKYICSDGGAQNVSALVYTAETYKQGAFLSAVYKYGNSFEKDGDAYRIVGNDGIDGSLQYIYNWGNTDVTNCFEDENNLVSNCGYKSLSMTHYSCFNLTGICSSYYYITSTNTGTYNSNASGLRLSNGKYLSLDLSDRNNIIYELLYQNDENGNVNAVNSTIKGIVDEWYKNFLFDDYDDYIEDTIFCSNRKITSFGVLNPNGGRTTGDDSLLFTDSTSTYDLSCDLITDKFSVSNNSAKLTYKVGLVSAPEIELIGRSEYAVIHSNWFSWLLSPHSYGHSAKMNATSSSTLTNYLIHMADYTIRPSISLIPGIKYTRGSGRTDDPYIIDYNN